MDRSVWAIAALFYAAGGLSVVIVFEIFGGFQSSQPATTIVAVPGKTASTEEVVSKRPQPSFQNAQRAVIRTLKDPASAQFGRIFDGRGVVGMATVCREVNAKNGFGGYTGMTPFVYFPDNDRAELITNTASLQMTKEGINAYFKDCRAS